MAQTIAISTLSVQMSTVVLSVLVTLVSPEAVKRALTSMSVLTPTSIFAIPMLHAQIMMVDLNVLVMKDSLETA